jgi:hypothetical protein
MEKNLYLIEIKFINSDGDDDKIVKDYYANTAGECLHPAMELLKLKGITTDYKISVSKIG